MAALASLVAGVAHEINTPIGVSVTGITKHKENTEILLKKYEQQSMTQTDLEKYFRQSQSIADLTYRNLQKTASLVSNFKKISVEDSSEPLRKFDLVMILKESINSISTKLQSTDTSIEFDIPDELPVCSYPDTFTQIISCLAINAISHGYDKDESPVLKLGVSLSSENIELIFTDYGKGIEKAYLTKIFDPFFKLNQLSEGTGLGLNIVYNLVTQRLLGSIECHSAVGDFTSIHIYLPRNILRQ